MSDEADNQNIVPPEVDLTPLALAGEPATDKGFVTANGTRVRARVVKIAEQATRAPINGDERLAPSGLTLSLSLAALDAEGAVERDANGALLIMDRHEIAISDEAMKNPAFDPQEAVESALRQQAYQLEQRLAQRARTAAYLTEAWGGAVPEPADDG